MDLVEDIQETKTAEGLSRRELTDSLISLLYKSLKFCPTPSDLDRYSSRKDINDFIRRIRLKEYFIEGDNVEGGFFEYSCL